MVVLKIVMTLVYSWEEVSSGSFYSTILAALPLVFFCIMLEFSSFWFCE